MPTEAGQPSILFVCVHNAGRSQMAAAFARSLSQGAVDVRSAGSMPADQINPAVREAMLEVLDDQAGRSLEAVRPIRDDIERRVRDLLDSISTRA